MRRYKIEDIEGIGPAYGKRLRKANLRTTGSLLSACCTRKGRRSMAQATGVDERLLLEWANMADLMRITGVGPQYAELLEAAGVDTVKELRNRKPANLAAKMNEVNARRKLCRVPPALSRVEDWVAQAKKLDARMTY